MAEVAWSGREADPGEPVTDRQADTAGSCVTPLAPDTAGVTGPCPARPLWRSYLPALVVGSVGIIAGGLVAAVTDPLTIAHGSWSSAYLVLVAGVAQLALAGGQAMLAWWARHPVGGRLLLVEFVGWNLGNAAVIAGTLWNTIWLVDVGGGLLVVALGALLTAIRGGPGRVEVARGRRVALLAVRALVVLLLVSIPVGLWLAHVRAR